MDTRATWLASRSAVVDTRTKAGQTRRARAVGEPAGLPRYEATMQDDFDDGGMDLPDDDLTGGGELGDLEHGGEEGADLEMGGGEPKGRPSGGARAHAGGGKSGSRKSASRTRKGGAK